MCIVIAIWPFCCVQWKKKTMNVNDNKVNVYMEQKIQFT